MPPPVRIIPHPPTAPKPSDLPIMKRIGSAIKTAISTISGIDPSTQFSPLQPLAPFQPEIVARQFDFPVGYNINYLPRGWNSGLVPFSELRNLANNCEILRLGIETCIDQISTYEWQFVPREDSDMLPDDAKVTEITEFFKSPDKIHTFNQWLGCIIDELLTTDAVSIYRPKTRGGKPYAFELLDGATIFPMIDERGSTPMYPNPSYQQIIKGQPRVDYDTQELLYFPKKMRVYTPYGFPATEQIITTAQKAISRDAYQLAYFTQGSIPDAYGEMPPGMTPDDIKDIETRFNNLLTGNPAQRRQVPFLPSGSKISQMKEAVLMDKFDEWMARLVCFSLGLPPNGFVQQQNRATAGSEKDRADEEGQAPRIAYVKQLLDLLIADFGPEYSENIEAKPRDSSKRDPVQEEIVLSGYTKGAIMSIDEARAQLGLDPLPDGAGAKAMALTPTGYVPLDAFEQQQEMQAQGMQAQAEAKANAQQNQQQQPGGDQQQNQKLRKAVRHTAIPLEGRRSYAQKPHSHAP